MSVRVLLPLLLAFACLLGATEPGSPDPAFAKIPFDEWIREANPGPFHWGARMSRPQISFHQRLVTRFEALLDGRDLEARRADGELVVFMQITDSKGQQYQHHHAIDLAKLDEKIRSSNVEYLQRVFVLPGDYRVATAILDAKTGEHGTRQVQLRVAAPHSDWLPDAWHDLPAVEYIASEDPPESWYLPEIHGKLQWAAGAHPPVRFNVVLNVAPSAPGPRSHRSTSGAMAALVPTLKALSETGSPSLTQHLEMIDLARRRSALRQDDGRELSWDRFKTALEESNTASIDIHSLSDRHHDAQFFANRVRKMVAGSESLCVLVVLTPPVEFESGEDLTPISLEGLPACRVFYIRYYEPVEMQFRPILGPMGGRGRIPRETGGPVPRGRPAEVVDQLEATLKTLNPKVFDVQTPEQFGHAMAEVRKALLAAQPASP